MIDWLEDVGVGLSVYVKDLQAIGVENLDDLFCTSRTVRPPAQLLM